MENNTINIDVRKLQILNDRICQTLDALNQLRWSAQNGRTQSFSPLFNNGVHSTMNNVPFGHQHVGIPTMGAWGSVNNSWIPTTASFGHSYPTGVPFQFGQGAYTTPVNSFPQTFGSPLNYNTVQGSYAMNGTFPTSF